MEIKRPLFNIIVTQRTQRMVRMGIVVTARVCTVPLYGDAIL